MGPGRVVMMEVGNKKSQTDLKSYTHIYSVLTNILIELENILLQKRTKFEMNIRQRLCNNLAYGL